MAVSNVSRKYKDPDNRGLRDTVPANENRRPVRGKVVPFPTGQASDSNPLHQTQDEAFSTRYQNPWTRNDENVAKQRINRVERQYAPAAEPSYRETRIPIIRKKVKHKVPTSEKVIARLKVSAINGWVISWAAAWYFSFQWWLSLLSLTGLGMAVAAYAIIDSIEETFLGGVLTFFIGSAEDGLSGDGIINKVIAGAFSLFGISFDPLLLFIAPSAILLIVGVAQLLITWFMYSGARVKSLSGTHGGLKQLSFVLALISSVTPIPLIFIWIAVVWAYPK